MRKQIDFTQEKATALTPQTIILWRHEADHDARS